MALYRYAALLLLGAAPVFAQEATPVPNTEAQAEAATKEGVEAVTDALEGAAEGARDLGAGLLERAQDAIGAAGDNLSDASDEVRKSVAAGAAVTAISTTEDMQAVSAWVRREEIVTREGIDFDKAYAAVEASDATEEAKAAMADAITAVRDGLEEMRQGLRDLNSQLDTEG